MATLFPSGTKGKQTNQLVVNKRHYMSGENIYLLDVDPLFEATAIMAASSSRCNSIGKRQFSLSSGFYDSKHSRVNKVKDVFYVVVNVPGEACRQ